MTQRSWILSRRDFLKRSGALVGIGSTASLAHGAKDSPGEDVIFRFGVVTDTHYADREPKGTRYYRESLPKLQECIDKLNTEDLEFLIELGDFKDERETRIEAETLDFLREIESVFAGFRGPHYHVLGNHDLDSISKAQFQEIVTNTGIPPEKTWYSFDQGNIHCVVLDANFRNDGVPYDKGNFSWRDPNIPQEQLDWLRQDLGSTRKPVLVFCHQLLTGVAPSSVINAEAVRAVLEDYGSKVLAAFHGHKHDGDHQEINGIHYYTHKAVVEGSGPENNAYSIVEVFRGGDIQITGFRQAETRILAQSS